MFVRSLLRKRPPSVPVIRGLTTKSAPVSTPPPGASTTATATAATPSAARRQYLIDRQLREEAAAAATATKARANASLLHGTPTLWKPEFPAEATARQIENFQIFNRTHGKFRVSIINQCNMNCFFCHNEGMWNPRQAGETAGLKRKGPAKLSTEDMIAMMNAFSRMGGNQINVTGGEPLTHPDIVHILTSIEKRHTKIVLNSNVLNAERLLRIPRIHNLTSIFASLHTTSETLFKTNLGVPSGGAQRVMDNMVALKEMGYDVQINYSLGEYNRDEFGPVMDFAIRNGIHVKAIALIRPNDKPGFYNGSWIDPQYVHDAVHSRGCVLVGDKAGFGGLTKVYRVKGRETDPTASVIQVKNIAIGRLVTDYCNGCKHSKLCGEGIYALRAGADGIFKPCLLRTDGFTAIDNGTAPASVPGATADGPLPPPSGDMIGRPVVNRDAARAPKASYDMQILSGIEKMVGDWKNAYYTNGAPQ